MELKWNWRLKAEAGAGLLIELYGIEIKVLETAS